MQEAAKRKRTRAYVVLGLSLVAISFSGIFVRLAGAPGAVSGFYRMAIPLVLLTLPFVRNARVETEQGKLNGREIWIALLAGLFFAADLFFWNTGVLLSGATNPTLMSNTAPIWVGIGAMIFFREQPGRGFWIGLLIAIGGAAVILGVDALNNVGLGTFFGFLSGVFYGLYFLVVQRSRQRLSTMTSFWLSAASSSVMLAVVAHFLNHPLTGYSPLAYVYMAAIAIVVQLGGQMGVAYTLGYLPASIVAPTLLLQPVLTGLLAVPLLHEPLTMIQVIGGAAVLAGIYIVHRSRQEIRVPADVPTD